MGNAKRPLIIAHRGVGSPDEQNTLAAFERAVSLGVDMVEFDIRRTSDNEFVVHHDAAIHGHQIARMTLREIRELRPGGSRVTTLTEVLDVVPSHVGLDIELKEMGYEREVVQHVLNFRGPEGFVVTSFSDRSVCAVRASFPDVRTGLLLGMRRASFSRRLRELFPARRARACWASCIGPHARLLRFGYLTRMAHANIPVCVWTVNDEAGLVRMISDQRVHGIVTDEPELALRLRDSIHGKSEGRNSR